MKRRQRQRFSVRLNLTTSGTFLTRRPIIHPTPIMIALPSFRFVPAHQVWVHQRLQDLKSTNFHQGREVNQLLVSHPQTLNDLITPDQKRKWLKNVLTLVKFSQHSLCVHLYLLDAVSGTHSDFEGGSVGMRRSRAPLSGQSFKRGKKKKERRRILVILLKIAMILAVRDSIHHCCIVNSCKAICH